MLKLKIGQLQPTLAALESIGEMKVPMNVARKIASNMKAIREVIEMSDERRKEILDKHGDKSDEQPDSFKVRPECMEDFNKEWAEFMKEEVEFPEVRRIKIKELPPSYTIEPTKLELLDWMFIDENTQKVVPIDVKAVEPDVDSETILPPNMPRVKPKTEKKAEAEPVFEPEPEKEVEVEA